MGPDKDRVVDYMSVGGQAFVEVLSGRGWTKRVQTRFRGWIAGEYIFLDTPTSAHEAAHILKDARCVVRFIHDGSACGFDSAILDWSDMGMPFFRIAWPKEIQVLHVRKHARIPVNLPCTIHHPWGEDHGEIEDLSSGGCGLIVARPFADGTALRLSFVLPDGVPVKGLSAVVCRTRPQENGTFIGCRYTDEPEGDHSSLIFYMTTTLSRMGLQPLSDKRVLLVHHEHTDVQPVLQAFDRAGVQAITANNIVDAFYRLRMMAPGCLILDVRQPVFSVVDVCTAVRHTPGIELIPLFLMGGDRNDQELLIKCNAQAWFSQERLHEKPEEMVALCLRAVVRST